MLPVPCLIHRALYRTTCGELWEYRGIDSAGGKEPRLLFFNVNEAKQESLDPEDLDKTIWLFGEHEPGDIVL